MYIAAPQTAKLEILVFTLLSAGVLFAQNGFAYTHEDSFFAPNTVSLMAIQGDGSLTRLQSFNTVGMGNAGNGFDADRRHGARQPDLQRRQAE